MTNSRRIAAMLLSGLMIVSLAACSEESKKTEAAADQSASTSQKAETPKTRSSTSSTEKDDMGRTVDPKKTEQQVLIDHVQEMIDDQNASENAVFNYLVVDNNVSSETAQLWIDGLKIDWNEVAYRRYVQLVKDNQDKTGLEIQDEMGSKDGFTPDQIVYAANHAVTEDEAPTRQ